VVAVPLRIDVDERDHHEADDDERREHDAGVPRVEEDQHLLQAEEVPRRLRRIRRARGVGRLLERRVDQQRPDQQQEDDDERAEELAAHQERPGVHLVVAGAGGLLDRDLASLAGPRADRGLRLGRRHRRPSSPQLSSSSRSAERRADQKIRTSTSTKKNGSTITRPPGIKNAKTTIARLAIAYLSSDGIGPSEGRTGEAVAPD